MEYQPHRKTTRYSDLSDIELIEIIFKNRIDKNIISNNLFIKLQVLMFYELNQ